MIKNRNRRANLLKNLSDKILTLAVAALALACTDEPLAPDAAFFKIYDDSNFDVSYKPIDVVETNDGFVILTGTELVQSDFEGVGLLKTDKQGNFQLKSNLERYVVPIGELLLNEADSNVYFFAMDPTSLEAVLISVNTELEVIASIPMTGINYPLASAILSNGHLLLLSYDPVEKETEVSEITLDGAFVNGISYSIGPGDDVEEDIINHYINAGDRPLPFFCGESSPGSYFFNGFYNYSLSTVFTNFGEEPEGVVQGQGSNAGLRAAMYLDGSEFSIAGYQFDENFQLASTTLTTQGLSSSSDLYTGDLAEIKPYSPTEIIQYVNGESYTLFANETKGRQILLTFYGPDDTIAGVHRIGSLNPFTFASVKTGTENSLLVLGSTFAAGRFERIALIKLSADEISDIIK